jgi:glucose-1-phosphate cytidylyltransferase
MKVVILAGGLGSRISEETITKPKPMIEIGGKPILWHIMKIYSFWGYNEFVICLGYKGYLIKEYFNNYLLHQNDVTVDLKKNKINYKNFKSEKWKINLVDTGEETMTGGRIKRVFDYVKEDKYFFLTYGDAVSNLNIKESLVQHINSKKLTTLTAVNPPARFGNLVLNNNAVSKFSEKPKLENGLINGGFFITSPTAIKYIADDNVVWEKEPLENLAKNKQLNAYVHRGFWEPMDTLFEKNLLNTMWNNNKAPWKIWKD